MELTKVGTVSASEIKENDLFELAGSIYRIVAARTRFIEEVEIFAVNTSGRSPQIKIEVRTNTPFTIYTLS